MSPVSCADASILPRIDSPRRARSSAGQSGRLIIGWSLVRPQPGPPFFDLRPDNDLVQKVVVGPAMAATRQQRGSRQDFLTSALNRFTMALASPCTRRNDTWFRIRQPLLMRSKL